MSDDSFSAYVAQHLGFWLQREASFQGVLYYDVPVFKQPNRNHADPRPQGASVGYLVIHYTAELLLDTLKTMTRDTPDHRVSSHYIVTETEVPSIAGGLLIRVVPETERAWHAGVSIWQGRENLNDVSIGIELVNQGIDPSGKWVSFDEHQLHTLGILAKDIVQRYNISPTCVVGHADIAPSRKQDPGPLFPWELLYARYGVGAWLSEDERTPASIERRYSPKDPLPKSPDMGFALAYLKALGYGLSDAPETFEASLRAFQAHFSWNQCPEFVGSSLSLKDLFWMWALVWKYSRPLLI